MTDIYITTNTINAAGNGANMTEDFQYLYVDGGVTLGSTLSGGSAVQSNGQLQSIDVAGRLFGFTGVDFITGGGTVHIFSGGSLAAGYQGIFCASGTYATVINDGTISANRGLYANGNATVVNNGTITGQVDAIFILGDGDVTNHGSIYRTVFVNGVADISNYGTITGDISTQGQADTVINRGLVTGFTQTGAGNDFVDGIGGRFEKAVSLGAGNDTFWGGDAADVVTGNTGNDDIGTGGGNDRVLSLNADGNDSYDAGTGSDIFDARLMTTGIAINLTLGEARNGIFVDTLAGFEHAFGGAGSDRIAGNAVGNVLRGATGNDLISALDGNDVLFGDAGNDVLAGGNGNDRLFGGAGVDNLNGGAGSDQLTGSYDIDLMTGGTEADRFIFTNLDEFFAVVGTGLDRITDFQNGIDLIDLSTLDARFNLAGDQAFTFIGTAAITAFGQLSYRIAGGNTIISVGVNTTSALDVIRLDGVHTMTAADFFL